MLLFNTNFFEGGETREFKIIDNLVFYTVYMGNHVRCTCGKNIDECPHLVNLK